ncbi:MAG: hypothetical protein AB1921_01945 [Thermodesulfobacteriota bacterium]
MKRMAILLLILCACAVSCTTVQTKAASIPQVQMAEVADCRITMTPVKNNNPFYVAFSFEFENQSGTDLAVDWNRSRYFNNGQNLGRLVARGMEPKQIADGTVPPDIVPAGGTFSRVLAPKELIAWDAIRDRGGPGLDSALSAGKLPSGVNKVVLVMKKDGKELTADLSVDLKIMEVPEEENF